MSSPRKLNDGPDPAMLRHPGMDGRPKITTRNKVMRFALDVAPFALTLPLYAWVAWTPASVLHWSNLTLMAYAVLTGFVCGVSACSLFVKTRS